MRDNSERIDDSGDGKDLYAKLPHFADIRREQLLSQLQPVQELIDSYGSLIARATIALGSVAPQSRHEVVVRDLMADVFDFLYEWPRPLFEGRPHVAFPLARRAYESLSLLSACYQDASIACRWDRGKQIGNAEIRKALANLPFPEPEQAMKNLYAFFSTGTHPNRTLIAERFLGDGNQFTLGSSGDPELALVLAHCAHLVDMWFWFGAMVVYEAKDVLAVSDPSFAADYMDAADRAADIKRWLAESFSKVLKARQEELRAEGY